MNRDYIVNILDTLHAIAKYPSGKEFTCYESNQFLVEVYIKIGRPALNMLNLV